MRIDPTWEEEDGAPLVELLRSENKRLREAKQQMQGTIVEQERELEHLRAENRVLLEDGGTQDERRALAELERLRNARYCTGHEEHHVELEHLREEKRWQGGRIEDLKVELARERELSERLREEKDAGWQAYEYAKGRLHRIEEAAREHLRLAHDDDGNSYLRLRDALGSDD